MSSGTMVTGCVPVARDLPLTPRKADIAGHLMLSSGIRLHRKD